jgi:exodeoxyribonuclease III
MLRLMTWNCRSGSIAARLSQLARYRPDVVFLQECQAAESMPAAGQMCRRIGKRKGIALIVSSRECDCVELEPRPASGRAMIGATVGSPVRFTAFGIWAQGTDYVGDVLRTLEAYGDLLRSGPAVVMGDFNSGSTLDEVRSPSKRHQRLVDTLGDFGLTSAYHAFHGVEHGREKHATYFHQFKRARPWHIDFCFVPRAWIPRLANVRVIDRAAWTAQSDHRPLLVELNGEN